MQWLISMPWEGVPERSGDTVSWYFTWQIRKRPWQQCREGDEVFILKPSVYESRGQVTFAKRFEYNGEDDLVQGLKRIGRREGWKKHPYFGDAAPRGYCLALEWELWFLQNAKLRPQGFSMTKYGGQHGWLALDKVPAHIPQWLQSALRTLPKGQTRPVYRTRSGVV